MPQPALDIPKYLASPLPSVREQYPPGTGGTGQRLDWPDDVLKGVQVIDDFEQKVQAYSNTLPKEPVKPHPAYKYPSVVQATSLIPNVIKAPTDLQKALSTLPLSAVSSVLTALDADEADLQVGPTGAQALDKAGYESDGGEEVNVEPSGRTEQKTKAWYWQFNKSPFGSGEFYLKQQGSDEVKLVVRTINSSAFTSHDWEEFVVTGPYHYNTKSKASWYWSRTWAASNRLKSKYWVLTDWKRWVFGKFDEELQHGWVSPIKSNDAVDPSILQTLFFWSKSAIGDSNGFKAEKKDVSKDKALFPDNPARRVSTSGKRATVSNENRVKTANESDIEESDAE